MPSAALQQIERRLTELACPPGQMRRKIRELAEHHEDLKRDALEEGLSETDAEARADELLGEPVVLAGHLAAALRQSSWWGRHPFIGFCLLPPFAIILLFMLALTGEYWLGRLYFTETELGSLTEWETGLKYCGFAMFGAYYGTIVLVAGLACVLSRRRISGFKWACIACVICAVHGAFFYTWLTPHNFAIGFTNQMHWIAAFLPLGVAFLLWLKLQNAANRLPSLPARTPAFRASLVAVPKVPKTGLLNPTTVITTLVLAVLGIFIYQIYLDYHRPHARPAKPAAIRKPAVPTTH
jgi:hypothetical protein